MLTVNGSVASVMATIFPMWVDGVLSLRILTKRIGSMKVLQVIINITLAWKIAAEDTGKSLKEGSSHLGLSIPVLA